jgi:hypothetical protein
MTARSLKSIIDATRDALLTLVSWLIPSTCDSDEDLLLFAPDVVERTNLRVQVVRSLEGDVVFLPHSFNVARDYSLRLRASGRTVEFALPAHLRTQMAGFFADTARRRASTKLEYGADGELQLLISSRREAPLPSKVLERGQRDPILALLRRRLLAWRRIEYARLSIARRFVPAERTAV